MNNIIFIAIIFLMIMIGATVYFINLPKEKKIENVKEWLKYAVVQAEKELGSGTGKLKLRFVYDMAVDHFPWLVTLVQFEVFSKWVDEALDWMRTQVSENKATQRYIENK